VQKSNIIDDAIHRKKIMQLYDDKLKTLYLLRGKIEDLIKYYEEARRTA
jgi:hypothetical protein